MVREALKLEESSSKREIQIFMSYLACFSFSYGKSKNLFFAQLMENPSIIHDLYIPFLPNTKNDYTYFSTL